MSDKEVGKLYRHAMTRKEQGDSWSYDLGYKGPDAILGCIDKLIEERAQNYVRRNYGARYSRDRARRDYGVKK